MLLDYNFQETWPAQLVEKTFESFSPRDSGTKSYFHPMKSRLITRLNTRVREKDLHHKIKTGSKEDIGQSKKVGGGTNGFIIQENTGTFANTKMN